VIHRGGAAFVSRRVSLLSAPENPIGGHKRGFVTTKLREKFVARIAAAGVRSHAKGKEEGETKNETESATCCPPCAKL
jgi:hypothetical protein